MTGPQNADSVAWLGKVKLYIESLGGTIEVDAHQRAVTPMQAVRQALRESVDSPQRGRAACTGIGFSWSTRDGVAFTIQQNDGSSPSAPGGR